MVAKVMRGRARVRGEVCSNPRGEEPGEETEEESRYKKLNDLQREKSIFFLFFGQYDKWNFDINKLNIVALERWRQSWRGWRLRVERHSRSPNNFLCFSSSFSPKEIVLPKFLKEKIHFNQSWNAFFKFRKTRKRENKQTSEVASASQVFLQSFNFLIREPSKRKNGKSWDFVRDVRMDSCFEPIIY